MRSLILFITFFPVLAYAALGDHRLAIESEQKQFSLNSHESKQQINFTVHIFSKPGLTIKEYEDKNGRIFAVTWLGIAHPDLQKILGEYLSEFQDAQLKIKLPHGQRRSGKISTDNIILERASTAGQVRGRAYIIKALPENVSLHDID